MNKKVLVDQLLACTKNLYDSIPDINFDKEDEPVGKYSMIKMLVESKAREILDALIKLKTQKTDINLFEDSDNLETGIDEVEENLNTVFKKVTALGIDLIFSKLEVEIDKYINARIKDEFEVVMQKVVGVVGIMSSSSQEIKVIGDRLALIESWRNGTTSAFQRMELSIKKIDEVLSGMKMYKASTIN